VAVDGRVLSHRDAVVPHLAKAGRMLELRQVEQAGLLRGNVSPWASRADEDPCGTLMAIWVWARHQALSGEKRFEENRELAWRFVLEAGVRYLPDTIGPGDYEAPFACACLLRAALADRAVGGDDARQAMAELACDALRTYLSGLASAKGRECRDAGFILWSLVEYARASDETRALKVAGDRAERWFGTRPPPPPAEEPSPEGALYDFLSTSATQALGVAATLGETPYAGAWLRERVLPVLPPGFIARPRDEHSWNASLAWLFGRGYTLTHAPGFLAGYFTIMGELARRDRKGEAALGRDERFGENETLPTWAWAMAMDALEGR
jgi:hypothetical protein